jgi:glycosyltransferase involved in cell wall biosynthesis
MSIRDPAVTDSNLDTPQLDPAGIRIFVAWCSERLQRWPTVHDWVQRAYRAFRDAVSRISGHRTGKRWHQFALPERILAELAAYDVVYLPFPYYLQPAVINAPVVATFHDFNHLYFPANFGLGLRRQVDKQLRYWSQRADAATVSTQFIQNDLLKYYPGAAGRSSVIFVAPYARAPLANAAREAVLRRTEAEDRGFVLYPANHSHHKNLLSLIKAADLLKRSQRGRLRYPILFTGFGTDGIGAGRWPSLKAVDTFLSESALELGRDVRGLGYVSDEEVDGLTQSARLVVSTSLYEAGCGPALDAWQFGVPVAFSNIEPFVEQLDVLGVEAWRFDPNDPQNIADVLAQALEDEETSASMAIRSRAAIEKYTWAEAAASYIEVFHTAVRRYNAVPHE